MPNIKNLFQIMNEKNITKAMVSRETGISTGNLSDWANGRCLPSAEKLDVLANYLDCSVDYLLGREVTSPSDEGITLYNKLDAEDKAEVRGTMKQMLKAGKYQHNTDIAVAAKKTPTKPEVKKKPKNT